MLKQRAVRELRMILGAAVLETQKRFDHMPAEIIVPEIFAGLLSLAG